jgi:hypothetical protein
MKTLPNGVTIFNATPHPIRFWSPEWPKPIEVPVDEPISARIEELPRDLNGFCLDPQLIDDGIEFVVPEFISTAEATAAIRQAYLDGADIVVGSIILAQAMAGEVAAMVPCQGYERVPPDQKRMRPDKFTVF